MAASQRLVAAALLLLAARQALAGFYGTSDDVVTLTPANFDQLVGQNDSVWLVELYAQWSVLQDSLESFLKSCVHLWHRIRLLLFCRAWPYDHSEVSSSAG